MISVILVMIGLILGVLITMSVETSRTVSYMHQCRSLEVEQRKLRAKNAALYDRNCELQSKIVVMKEVLKTKDVKDFEDW